VGCAGQVFRQIVRAEVGGGGAFCGGLQRAANDLAAVNQQQAAAARVVGKELGGGEIPGAPAFADDLLLAVAEALEKIFPSPDPPAFPAFGPWKGR